MQSFRNRLQEELEWRRQRNPRYSLRAFALMLGADHSTLSQILRGARRVPVSQIPTWGRRLGMTSDETAIHVVAEQLAHGTASMHQESLRQWVSEAIYIVTEPAHWEILRLSREPGFQADSRWVAEQAGIGVDRVNMAFDRLLRLGLVEAKSPGEWRDLTGLERETGCEFRKLAIQRLKERAAEADVDLGL